MEVLCMKKGKNRTPIICLLAMLLSMSTISSAATGGKGNGVSLYPPMQLNQEGEIQPYGTSPPSANQTHNLDNGEYNGTIEWATGVMHTNKWVYTTGTTISLTANFGTYYNKTDAINRQNPILPPNTVPNIVFLLTDGSTSIQSSITADKSSHTVNFSVQSGKKYYITFDFRSGRYHSGDFSIHK